jgi:hypothetical protein
MHMKVSGPKGPKWEPRIAAPEQVLKRLTNLVNVGYALIEEGIAEAESFAQQRGSKLHRVVFATIVRQKVFQELEPRTADEGIACRVLLKGNVGVRVIYQGSTIAVWKADKDGQLPACGESLQRQDFYRQAVLPETYDNEDVLPRKLALLWEINAGVLEVKLVAPRGFKTLFTAGLVHWTIDVPHPAKTITAATDLASGAEELDEILKHKKTADEPDDES